MNNPLISALDLKVLIQQSNNLVIIDTRSPIEYDKGHIPGAIVNHNIFTYVTSEELGGLDDLVDTFSHVFGNAGIRDRSHVVIYEDAHNNGFGQSCRGYFILQYLGHKKISILNGGYQSWIKAGFLASLKKRVPTPVTFVPKLNSKYLATTSDMLYAITNKNAIILDCRDKDEWEGKISSPYDVQKIDINSGDIIVEEFCPRKGKIPGAVWIEWKSLMKDNLPDPMFLSKDEILEKCKGVGISKDTTVYVYCFKGSRASNTLLALQLAGIKNVKNYFESWNVWSRDINLPIEM